MVDYHHSLYQSFQLQKIRTQQVVKTWFKTGYEEHSGKKNTYLLSNNQGGLMDSGALGKSRGCSTLSTYSHSEQK